jgi:hypothetical protein
LRHPHTLRRISTPFTSIVSPTCRLSTHHAAFGASVLLLCRNICSRLFFLGSWADRQIPLPLPVFE